MARFAPINLAPATLVRRLAWRTGDALVFWRDCLISELEDRRGFIWLPVAFGTGILLYFALPREPLLAALGLVVFATAFGRSAPGSAVVHTAWPSSCA